MHRKGMQPKLLPQDTNQGTARVWPGATQDSTHDCWQSWWPISLERRSNAQGTSCVPWRGLCSVSCPLRATSTPGTHLLTQASMEAKNSNKNVVLVVGAQFAGLRARMLLQQQDSSRRAAGGGAGEGCKTGFEVVLVDEKDYFEFTPSVLRCMLHPQAATAAACLAPHDGAVQIHRLTALHSTPHGVTAETASGATLQADYCLLCCGADYTHPIKWSPSKELTLEARATALAATGAQLQQAGSVVVVGGGSVGVELAAELAAQFGTRCRVTLVTSSSRLLPRMSERASSYTQSWLRSHGVEVLLGQQLMDAGWTKAAATPGPHVLQTTSGYVLKSDMVFDCTGGAPVIPAGLPSSSSTSQMPATAAAAAGSGGGMAALLSPTAAAAAIKRVTAGLRRSSPTPQAPAAESTPSSSAAGSSDKQQQQQQQQQAPDTWQASKGIAVTNTQQVVGHDRIFAAGDCMACPFERTAVSAKLSATLAATNIGRHARGEPLLHYPQDVCFGAAAPPSIQGISLGPSDGLLELQGQVVLTGRAVAILKARIEATQFLSLKRPAAAWAWYYQEQAMVWCLTAGLRYVQLLLGVLKRAWRGLCCGVGGLAHNSSNAPAAAVPALGVEPHTSAAAVAMSKRN